jgi:hypothetical protein
VRRPGLRSLVVLLGGGIFVVAAIAGARVLLRRRTTGASAVRRRQARLEPATTEWVAMPPTAVPAMEPPALSLAEQVVPHARDAEDVVDSLVPAELQRSGPDRRVDLLIAALVIIAAAAVIFAIVQGV